MHVVASGNFAGVERYVATVARETARRAWKTTVIGGLPDRMRAEIGDYVRHEPGRNVFEAVRSLTRHGRADIVHAHMTHAEAVALATRRVHRGCVVATRHFAQRRGSSIPGHLVASLMASALDSEIATSEFVAAHVERPPSAVIPIGIPACPLLWQRTSRIVLVMQRLEAEKDTFTALRAWSASALAEKGWGLRIVGAGVERPLLERWAAREQLVGVSFAGWQDDVRAELARAGILLATATAEPVGLTVVEAMGAGVPVVASAAGGHLETIGRLPDARLFPPGNADVAGAALRSLLGEAERAQSSETSRRLVAQDFTIERHVDRLVEHYGSLG